MSILAISGKKSSGKDTVGKIIQYLTGKSTVYPFDLNIDYSHKSNWQIKKFAFTAVNCSLAVSLPDNICISDAQYYELSAQQNLWCEILEF